MASFEGSNVKLHDEKSSGLKFQNKTKTNRRIIIGGVIAVAILAIVIGVAVGVPLSRRDTGDQNMQRVKQILESVPLIDGHNDLPWQFRQFAKNKVNNVNLGEDTRTQWESITKEQMTLPGYPRIPPQTDIKRLRDGMVGAQFWAIFADCGSQEKDAVRIALDTTAATLTWIYKYPDTFQFVTTRQGIEDAFANRKIASLLGLEGGHMIGNTYGVLRMFYRLGVRYMTITHSCDTPWADSWKVDTPNYNSTNNITGLSDWGKNLIKEMNRLGMIVDLSHVSKQTMIDSITASRAPVIFSHSSAFGYCNHFRNVQDDVLIMTKNNGGLVMINFYDGYINCYPNNQTNATLSQVADHFDYVKNKIGVDYVGVGADYDGVPTFPEGLEDVSTYPDLFAELVKRGYTDDELKKIAGQNFLRVFQKVEEVRDSLTNENQQEDLFPFETIDQTCHSSF